MTGALDQVPADPPAEARPGQPSEAERPSALILYDELRERILQGRFDPRVPISQVRLARELGVSRTPLREALRMLQAEGLNSVGGEPQGAHCGVVVDRSGAGCTASGLSWSRSVCMSRCRI